jgi:hypothetical protein
MVAAECLKDQEVQGGWEVQDEMSKGQGPEATEQRAKLGCCEQAHNKLAVGCMGRELVHEQPCLTHILDREHYKMWILG